ncbi:MAG: WD40 repeat domain-containing protein [Actinomycetota bacterium]
MERAGGAPAAVEPSSMPSPKLPAALLAVLIGLGASPVGADPAPGCPLDGYDDRCEIWVQVEDDPDGLAPSQSPTALAASPDGRLVYMSMLESTGAGFDSKSRWAVVARDAGTGALVWAYREVGAPTEYAFPTTIAVAPDGSRVYVSGSRRPQVNSPDSRLTTSAFDAATGGLLWTSTYDGSPGIDNARKLVVSPDGTQIFVAGISGPGANLDYAAISYDAATGQEKWVTRYEGIGANLVDSPFDVAVSDDGETLAMTGWSGGPGEFDLDFGTVAFDTRGPSAGAIRWVSRYEGLGFRAPDRANAIAISPDGDTVFVGGMSGQDDDGPPFDVDYRFTTVAYDASTGAQLWEARRTWEGSTMTEVSDLAVAPDGSLVYATGYANGSQNNDMVTVAYDPATGAELGATREALLEHDGERGAAVVATQEAVLVAGASSTHLTEPLFLNQRRLVDQTTTAYSPTLGEKLWTARLNATTIGQTSGQSLVIAGDQLIVLGQSSDNVSVDTDVFDGVLAAYDLAA